MPAQQWVSFRLSWGSPASCSHELRILGVLSWGLCWGPCLEGPVLSLSREVQEQGMLTPFLLPEPRSEILQLPPLQPLVLPVRHVV